MEERRHEEGIMGKKHNRKGREGIRLKKGMEGRKGGRNDGKEGQKMNDWRKDRKGREGYRRKKKGIGKRKG